MIRRGLLLGVLLLLVFIWPQKVIINSAAEVSMSQVKASQTTAVSFTRLPDAPDPNKILALVNQTRKNYGITPLRASEELAAIARLRAADMASGQYYAHQDKTGKFYYDLMSQQGIVTDYSCENLDMEFGRSALPYVTSWLSSTRGHKECLLNNRVSSAGYAVVKLDGVSNTSDDSTYIVVAIHATDIK